MMRINAIIMAHKKMFKSISSSSPYSLLQLTNSLSSHSSRNSSIKSNPASEILSICTLNILAPCYKRLSSEYDRESSYENLWYPRHQSIIKVLQSLEANLICLQEFWFKNALFTQLYQSHLSSKYVFHTLQRTGSLDDGLAILVDSNRVKVIDKCEFRLNAIGQRVGLLLHLDFHGENVLLLNVHLTFPHYKLERRLRLQQIRSFLDLIHEYQLSKDLLDRCSIILCGDFNSSWHDDAVYQLIESNQFQSSYKVIHGHEATVTHLTHRKEELGVDFIFYKSTILRPIASELIPRGCDHTIWNDHTRWTDSDHRAVLTTFQYNN